MPDDERYERGRAKLREVHGDRSLETVESLGDLGRLIVEVAYGEVYSRPGLSLRDRQIRGGRGARRDRPVVAAPGPPALVAPRRALGRRAARGDHPDRHDRRVPAGDERDVDAEHDRARGRMTRRATAAKMAR
jgi:hypothetical protein